MAARKPGVGGVSVKGDHDGAHVLPVETIEPVTVGCESASRLQP